jgi:TetR/AcrR family transcriptional regulator, cholesterol catabolism regulator
MSQTARGQTATAAQKRGARTAKPPPQSKPLDKGRVLDEAARLFLEQGYDQTRLKDIASRFGVTHAALYYYFPRKSDILAELNLKSLDTLISGAKEAEAATDNPAERFQLQLDAHISFVVHNLPLVGCFFHYDKSIDPADLRTIHRLRRDYTEMLTDSFADAQTQGDFSSHIKARTAVNTLLGAANWMCKWLSADEPDDALVGQVGEMLAVGFQSDSRTGRN